MFPNQHHRGKHGRAPVRPFLGVLLQLGHQGLTEGVIAPQLGARHVAIPERPGDVDFRTVFAITRRGADTNGTPNPPRDAPDERPHRHRHGGKRPPGKAGQCAHAGPSGRPRRAPRQASFGPPTGGVPHGRPNQAAGGKPHGGRARIRRSVRQQARGGAGGARSGGGARLHPGGRAGGEGIEGGPGTDIHAGGLPRRDTGPDTAAGRLDGRGGRARQGVIATLDLVPVARRIHAALEHRASASNKVGATLLRLAGLLRLLLEFEVALLRRKTAVGIELGGLQGERFREVQPGHIPSGGCDLIDICQCYRGHSGS